MFPFQVHLLVIQKLRSEVFFLLRRLYSGVSKVGQKPYVLLCESTSLLDRIWTRDQRRLSSFICLKMGI